MQSIYAKKQQIIANLSIGDNNAEAIDLLTRAANERKLRDRFLIRGVIAVGMRDEWESVNQLRPTNY
jgi:hypothetical protein